jgi:hypothetical protein
MKSRTFAVFAVFGLFLSVASIASAESKEEFLKSLSAAPIQASTQSTCTANCGTSTVSCTGTSCTAVDSNCANKVRGRVTCGSTTTYCPPCSPPPTPCVDNAFCNGAIGQCGTGILEGACIHNHCVCP